MSLQHGSRAYLSVPPLREPHLVYLTFSAFTFLEIFESFLQSLYLMLV